MGGGGLADPPVGSTKADWREVTVALSEDRVEAFQRAFAVWIGLATRPAAEVSPPDDLTARQLMRVWERLPAREQEMLNLLADDFGQVVAWTDLKSKLGFAGDPSLALALPRLSRYCEQHSRRLPVLQMGKDDKAVFYLVPDLIDAVLASRQESLT